MRRKPFRKSKEGKMATMSIDREIGAPEKEHAIGSRPYDIYACPKCKHVLEPRSGILYCRACPVSYPILDGIPDFIAQDLEHSTDHDLRYIAKRDGSRWLNFLTTNYETYIYPPVCNLFGGWHSTSLQELARNISDIVGPTSGV
jgi:uncharacterized protein YbaR (Trm112 family)